VLELGLAVLVKSLLVSLGGEAEGVEVLEGSGGSNHAVLRGGREGGREGGQGRREGKEGGQGGRTRREGGRETEVSIFR